MRWKWLSGIERGSGMIGGMKGEMKMGGIIRGVELRLKGNEGIKVGKMKRERLVGLKCSGVGMGCRVRW